MWAGGGLDDRQRAAWANPAADPAGGLAHQGLARQATGARRKLRRSRPLRRSLRHSSRRHRTWRDRGACSRRSSRSAGPRTSCSCASIRRGCWPSGSRARRRVARPQSSGSGSRSTWAEDHARRRGRQRRSRSSRPATALTTGLSSERAMMRRWAARCSRSPPGCSAGQVLGDELLELLLLLFVTCHADAKRRPQAHCVSLWRGYGELGDTELVSLPE